MLKLRLFGTSSGGALFIHTVEVGNRLRLPSKFGDSVPWLKGDSCKAHMFLGQYGGVQISHEPFLGGKEVRQIISELRSSAPKVDEAGKEFMRLMRYQLMSCEAEFNKDGEDRFGIVLPREFRDIGVLPNHGESGAVLVLGDILEIWRADRLLEHARDNRGNLPEIINKALEELEKR